jgi:hypothetical protein
MKSYLVVFTFLAVFLCSCDDYEISSIQSESFIKYYALNRSNEGACVCEIPGGGYALLGNTTTDLRDSEICLLLTDVFGNSIQDPKYYGTTGSDRGQCIKPAPGGGFVILGSTHDTINGDKEVWLIRTNDMGDTLWTKTFAQFDKENGDDEGLWFDFNSKGEITMAGYIYKTDIGGYSKQIWIYDVGQDGNQIDNHKPITRGGRSDVEEARFVKRIDGDDFLIAGVSNITNNPNATSYSNITYLESYYNSTDLKYTESLNYFEEEDTSTLRDEANCLILVDNTTLLLCGSRVRTAGSQEAYLCRFNKIYDDENRFDPKMEWIRYYSNSGSSEAKHLLMEGTSVYILSTMSSTTDKSAIISVITTGLDGNTPVYQPIGGSSKMASRNFSFASDGGLIITGTNTDKDIIDISSMILIKTKTGGKL